MAKETRQKEIRKIVDLEQRNPGWCGYACLSMASLAFGVMRAQEYFVSRSKGKPSKGIDSFQIKRLKRDGFDPVEINRASWETLKDMRKRLPYPIMVEWRDDRSPGKPDRRHSLVKRVSDKRIVIHDPSRGKSVSLGRDYFEKRWNRPRSQSYTGWMLVIKK